MLCVPKGYSCRRCTGSGTVQLSLRNGRAPVRSSMVKSPVDCGLPRNSLHRAATWHRQSERPARSDAVTVDTRVGGCCDGCVPAQV